MTINNFICYEEWCTAINDPVKQPSIFDKENQSGAFLKSSVGLL